jgi:hypothetical protein
MTNCIKLFTLLGVLIGLLALYSVVSACGGFFCTNAPIDQSAERIIFTMNGDGTITAIVGINYTGEAEDFSWVVPVPSPPEVDVAETASLDALQTETNRQFVEPPNYCQALVSCECFGGGNGGEFLEIGTAGPYNYAIIRNENTDEMVTWLRENGYRITDEMIPLVQVYVDEGMYFLAMRLQQDAQVGDIQPVVMTYESEKPMIPIRLTAVAAIPNMPILTWIFADTQYAPENYAHVTPDFARFRTPSRITNVDFLLSPQSITEYSLELSRIQAEYEGLAFVTEYAQPTANLSDAAKADALIAELAVRFPYVTRLRAQMSPAQMTLDPTFIPAPEAADVSNLVELSDYTDPLDYWGCTTRATHDLVIEEGLDGFTYNDELHFGVLHPQDWVMSNVSIVADIDVWVLAPQAVDETTIAAYFANEAAVPMFVFMDAAAVLENCAYCDDPLLSLHYALGQPLNVTQDTSLYLISHIRFNLPTTSTIFYSDSQGGVIYGFLTTDEDWNAHIELYSAILRYPQTYQFYLSSELRHTLFFGQFYPYPEDSELQPIVVGFPEDWHASMDGAAPMITRLGTAEDTPLVRAIPLAQIWTPSTSANAPIDEAGRVAIAERYNLDIETVAAAVGDGPSQCRTQLPAVAFEKDGRQGYVRIVAAYVIEASASAADFVALDATLRAIVESANNPLSVCV